MMEYKGYIGKVEFDAEAGLFHGEVIDTRDVITFQGDSVAELTRAPRSERRSEPVANQLQCRDLDREVPQGLTNLSGGVRSEVLKIHG